MALISLSRPRGRIRLAKPNPPSCDALQGPYGLRTPLLIAVFSGGVGERVRGRSAGSAPFRSGDEELADDVDYAAANLRALIAQQDRP